MVVFDSAIILLGTYTAVYIYAIISKAHIGCVRHDFAIAYLRLSRDCLHLFMHLRRQANHETINVMLFIGHSYVSHSKDCISL